VPLVFLPCVLAALTASVEAAAKRWAVFAILPTAEPTPRAIVVMRSFELRTFVGMISPLEHCAAEASQLTASITTARRRGQ
jgi:hypothetical protein